MPDSFWTPAGSVIRIPGPLHPGETLTVTVGWSEMPHADQPREVTIEFMEFDDTPEPTQGPADG